MSLRLVTLDFEPLLVFDNGSKDGAVWRLADDGKSWVRYPEGDPDPFFAGAPSPEKFKELYGTMPPPPKEALDLQARLVSFND